MQFNWPALFACGLRRPLEELREELRRLVALDRGANSEFADDSDCGSEGGALDNAEDSAVFAYLDDTILAVPPQLVEAALNAAIEIFARAGHVVHPGKSGCWSLETSQEALPLLILPLNGSTVQLICDYIDKRCIYSQKQIEPH